MRSGRTILPVFVLLLLAVWLVPAKATFSQDLPPTTTQPAATATAVAKPQAEEPTADVAEPPATATAILEPQATEVALVEPQATDPLVYWGVLINGVPDDMSKLDTFEAKIGKKVSILHWGQPWVWNGAYSPFPIYALNRARNHGALPMLNWGSWHLGKGVNQPDFQLRDIYEGKYDSYIRKWATAAKDWGHPFFMRFNHEMNGWWYPWSEQKNGNRPGDYAKAWRHVHNIFTQVGATNVTWVWCVNVTHSPLSTPVQGLYPGDKYVNWIAVDAYNFGTDQDSQWETFSQVFKHTYDQLTKLYPTKPLMIAEMASSEDGGPIGRPASKAAWITDAFTTQIPKTFPKVKAVVWFNWNDGNPMFDWPIESSSSSITSFKTAIASSYYAGNTFGSYKISPIPPLGKVVPVKRLPLIIR